MPTKRAKDLRAGDRFSYVGAFKTYVAVSDAAPSSPGHVILDADAGSIQGIIQVQLLEERECTLHGEEAPKQDSPLLPGLRVALDLVECGYCRGGDASHMQMHQLSIGGRYIDKPCPRAPIAARIQEEERK